MNTKLVRFLLIALLPALAAISSVARAEEGGMHKVVIQVSSSDPVIQRTALNNAVNLQKAFGMDNVDVHVVAYGPGLSIMTKQSSQAKRVPSLAIEGIHFDACANTMRAIERKTGKKPVLLDGVKVVPSGVAQVVLLQEKGYAYVRP